MNTSVSIPLSAVDEPVCRSLSAGVCHMSEVMPTVLARYGLSIEERPSAERPTVAAGPNDFFDVSIAALESVLASQPANSLKALIGYRGIVSPR